MFTLKSAGPVVFVNNAVGSLCRPSDSIAHIFARSVNRMIWSKRFEIWLLRGKTMPLIKPFRQTSLFLLSLCLLFLLGLIQTGTLHAGSDEAAEAARDSADAAHNAANSAQDAVDSAQDARDQMENAPDEAKDAADDALDQSESARDSADDAAQAADDAADAADQ
jgi:hypothetical protein